MVITSFHGLRASFARRARTLDAVSFNGSERRASRASGSFITDNFSEGMEVDIIGSTSNDGRRTIVVLEALNMYFSGDSPTMADEAAGTRLLVGAFRDPDGLEHWPVDRVHASGFNTGVVAVNAGGDFDAWANFDAFPMEFTVDGGAVGPVPTHDTYLSQRSDLASRQYMALEAVPGATGSWRITLTPLAVLELGLLLSTSTLNADQMSRVLRYAAVYVRRQSDGKIQWLDLHKAVLG